MSMVLSATVTVHSILLYPPRSSLRKGKTSSTLKQVSSYPNSELVVMPNEERRRKCICFDLHRELVSYAEAWDWQKLVVEKKKTSMLKGEDSKDALLVLQHCPVFTLGTGSSEDYLNFDASNPPYELHRTDRGGEVTYHGPGQLVMYPIVNLRYHKMDLHWYLRELEEVVIRVLTSTFSIKASRVEGLTGVWFGEQKLAAIGVHVSKWIAYHGLALNVTTDLAPFREIVPCGIRNRQVGSIKGLLGESLFSKYTDDSLIDITYNSLIKEFSEVFQLELEQEPTTNQELFIERLSCIQ